MSTSREKFLEAYYTFDEPEEKDETHSDDSYTPIFEDTVMPGQSNIRPTISFTETTFEAHLTTLPRIGSGVSSHVYKATWGEQAIALKIMSKNWEWLAYYENEKYMLGFLNQHNARNIIKFIGCGTFHDLTSQISYRFIATELMPNNLERLIQDQNQPLPIELIYKFSIDLVAGVQTLHGYNILHCDLRSANVLVSGDHAKIGDLATAKFKKEKLDLRTALKWKAPEVILGNSPATEESDMYSAAVILWEMVTRKLPYQDIKDNLRDCIVKGAKEGRREVIPTSCPKELSDLITQTWDNNPEKRLTAAQLVSKLTFLSKQKQTSGVIQEQEMVFGMNPRARRDCS